MDTEQQLVVSLVRKAVDPKAEIEIPLALDWPKVARLAHKQGVDALCFDAMSMLDPCRQPDKDMLLKWLGQVSYMENCYESYRKTLDELAAVYESNGIEMMLLKGYGMSLLWPVPQHRPTGDIDVYFGDKWNEADKLVGRSLGVEVEDIHEHHTTFSYKGIHVENHYDTVNTKSTVSGKWLEKVLKGLARNGERIKIREASCYLPSAQFNAIFLMRHLGSHFCGSSVSLRQVLDWGFFMRENCGRVDWQEAMKVLKQIGIDRFFHQINAICVDYLGFDFDIAIDREEKLEKRVFEDIVSPEYEAVDRRASRGKGVFDRILSGCFRIRRFLANSWKRRIVYRDSIFSQLILGISSNLKRYQSI